MHTPKRILHRPFRRAPRRPRTRRAFRAVRTGILVALALGLVLPSAGAAVANHLPANPVAAVTAAETDAPAASPAAVVDALSAAADAPAATWVWPGGVARVVRPYAAPDHEYGPGHRGIDVAVAAAEVVAPDDGVVAFRGVVVDRPLITIDHGGGLVSTLEPVDSELNPGDAVSRGSVVGTLAAGGHAARGSLHLGARLDGEYLNPLALLGALQRPVLLPCCA